MPVTLELLLRPPLPKRARAVVNAAANADTVAQVETGAAIVTAGTEVEMAAIVIAIVNGIENGIGGERELGEGKTETGAGTVSVIDAARGRTMIQSSALSVRRKSSDVTLTVICAQCLLARFAPPTTSQLPFFLQLCFQVTIRATRDDLEDFFKQAGKVAEVHLIRDTRTKKSKGLAYIEMDSVESVPKALALCGQLVLGLPCIVQASQAERNRDALVRLNQQNNPVEVRNLSPSAIFLGILCDVLVRCRALPSRTWTPRPPKST